MTLKEQFDKLIESIDNQEDLIEIASENVLILDDGSSVDSTTLDKFYGLSAKLKELRSEFEEANILFDRLPTPEEQNARTNELLGIEDEDEE